jgi:hypothetical protein
VDTVQGRFHSIPEFLLQVREAGVAYVQVLVSVRELPDPVSFFSTFFRASLVTTLFK